VRREGGTTFMSGGAGYTYGANGVWNWNDGCCDDEQHEPPRWHEAIDIPSSYDMQRLVDFFAPLPWWELVPHEGLTSDGYVLATPGEHYLVYLPDLPLEESSSRWWWTGKQVEETAVALDLRDTGGTYAVSWFNPATGDTVAGEAITGGQRHNLIAPFSGDALLHLASE